MLEPEEVLEVEGHKHNDYIEFWEEKNEGFLIFLGNFTPILGVTPVPP